MKWKEYKPDKLINEHASKFWQLKIGKDLYANVFEYPEFENLDISYELFIQISDDKSILRETINIKVLHYIKKDFDLFEKHARKVIKALIK